MNWGPAAGARRSGLAWRLFGLLWIFQALAAGLSPSAQAGEQSFCMVPVRASGGGEVRRGEASYVLVHAGLQFPALYDMRAKWRLNDDREFMPVTTGFPKLMDHDRIVAEPSGRVIGKTDTSTLYVQDPADGQFHILSIEGLDRIGTVSDIAWAEHLGGIVVATLENGFYLLEDDSLIPIPGIDWKRTGGDVRLVELPAHRALALVTADNRLFFLSENDALHEARNLDLESNHPIGEIRELGAPGQLLVAAGDNLFLLSLTSRDGEVVPGDAIEVDQVQSRFPSRTDPLYLMSRLNPERKPVGRRLPGRYFESIGAYLAYGQRPGLIAPKKARLLRLGEKGWIPVQTIGKPITDEVPDFFEAPSRQAVYISTYDGLYRYDGAGSAVRIQKSGRNEIFGNPAVFDLPAFGKTVVAGKGLFELTANDELLPVSLPETFTDARFSSVFEMPAQGVAVAFSDRGVLTLDFAGNFSRVRGDDKADLRRSSGNYHFIPNRNEILVDALNGYFIVFSERFSGSGACGQQTGPVPERPLCLRQIPGARFAAMGSPSDPTGRPTPAPTGDRILLSAEKGLFQIDKEGRFSRYPGTVAGSIDAVTALPWSNSVLVTRADNEFLIIGPDGSARELASEGDPAMGLRPIGIAPRARTVLFGHADRAYRLRDGDPPRFDRVEGWATDIAELSWLDRPLLATNRGLLLLEPDGSTSPLPRGSGPGQAGDAVGSRDFGVRRIDPVEKFGFALLDAREIVNRNNQRLALKGLPAGGFPHFSGVFVPESGDGYMATWKGLWRLTPDGAVYPAKTDQPLGAVYAIVEPPWEGEVLVGAGAGLFRIDRSGEIDNIPGASAIDIGEVRKIWPVPWLGLVLVQSAYGWMVYSPAEGIQNLSAIGPQSDFKRVSVFPELQRIYAVKYGRGRVETDYYMLDLSLNPSGGNCSSG